jgi:hypothetical protein
MTAVIFINGQSTTTSRGHSELSAGYEGILPALISEIRQLRQQCDCSQRAVDATHNGWVYKPDAKKYYRVILELADWDTASSRCKELGTKSHLVVVNSENEHKAIKEFLSSIDDRLLRICRLPKIVWEVPFEGFWISGQRNRSRCGNEPWVWKPDGVTTLPMRVNFFEGIQPNCFNNGEHCLQYAGTSFTWNDLNCTWLACSLCEKTL